MTRAVDNYDHRRSFRMPVGFRVESAGDQSPSILPHELKDISSSGIRIRSGSAVPPGECVEIRFPDIDPVFVARGSVVWCQARERAEFDLGLQLEGDASDYEEFFTRVQEIEKYRQTVEDLRGLPIAPEDAARQWLSKFASFI